MSALNISPRKPFCDWLDFTVPSGSTDFKTIGSFFLSCCFVSQNDSYDTYKSPSGGVVKLSTFGSVIRVSISGSCLNFLRNNNLFDELVGWMSGFPHRITRLDAAYDVDEPGHVVIKRLRRKYKGFIELGQRSLPVKCILSRNSDGFESGTFYAGHRTKARTTARVYDKQLETFDRSGEAIPARTRYEMTVRGERGKKSPCLRDVYDPESIFWHVASPSLLAAPSGISPWCPDDSFTFVPERLGDSLPYDLLSRFVESSGFVETLHKLSGKLGKHGQFYALKMVTAQMEELSRADEASEGSFSVSGPSSSDSLDNQPTASV